MTEQQHQTADQVTQIITAWLKDICPIAIKSFDGGFVTADAGRVAHYIALNHGGVYSDQSLNDAVMNLWNVLTKFSTKEEDCQFRGRYATRPEPPRDPYANLSAEKLRQAGLKRISDGRVVPMASEDYASIQTHNHREDSKPKTQQELLQAAARSMLATQAGY